MRPRARRASHAPTVAFGVTAPRHAYVQDDSGEDDPPRSWIEQRREGLSSSRSLGGVLLVVIMVAVMVLAILLT